MKYLPVNWENGMKINQEHFNSSEKALRLEILNHLNAYITSYNYGLLPVQEGITALELASKNDQTQQVVIHLTRCLAITSNGMWVEIHSKQELLKDFKIKISVVLDQFKQLKKEEYLYVVLNINPFSRERYGSEIGDPPRQPHTIPSIFITVSPMKGKRYYSDGDTSKLTIGRLVLEAGEVTLDKKYIPPCSSIDAHKPLFDIFNTWKNDIELLFNNGKATLKQIREIKKAENEAIEFIGGEKISVSDVTWHLTQAMLRGIADLKPLFKHTLKEQPPIQTFIVIQQFAWKIKTTYEFLNQFEQKRFLNYLKVSIEAKIITKVLDKISSYTYNHEDIAGAVNVINEFLEYLKQLYEKDEGFPSSDFTWREEEIIFNESKPDDDGITFEDSFSG